MEYITTARDGTGKNPSASLQKLSNVVRVMF
jgi:hypothetical protein